MKQIASFPQFLIVLGLVVANSAYADPPRSPDVTCHGGGLTGPPQFGRVPPGVAEYKISGVCVTRTQDLGYQAIGKWTPSEPNPANANASEIYRIGTVSGPSRSFDVVLGACCDSDPWLNEHATCSRVGDNLSDELRELWPELAGSLFPYSRSAIPYDQRDALRAEYARINPGIGVPSTTAHVTDTIDQRADRIGLNPQTVAPRADSAAQAAPKKAGTNAGIIIVSGRDADPLARKSNPGNRVLDALAARGSAIANEITARAVKEIEIAKSPWAEAGGSRIIGDQMQSESFDASKQSPRTQPDNSIRVQVRYPVAYGYKDAASLFDSSPSSCGAFRIDVPAAVYESGRALIGIHTKAPMRTASGMYVCEYLVSDLPLGEPINLRVAMANQGAAASEAWLGGSDQPSGGQRRAIVNGDRQVTLTSDRPRASEVFEMVYAGASATEPVRAQGRVRLPAGTAANPPRAICDNARLARERNSPAAPGLEQKCLAAKGETIANEDTVVAAARNVEADVLYRQGFDIATGIFGDPALGAQGNTAWGPGSQGIRDRLTAAGQRGFNASAALHGTPAP